MNASQANQLRMQGARGALERRRVILVALGVALVVVFHEVAKLVYRTLRRDDVPVVLENADKALGETKTGKSTVSARGENVCTAALSSRFETIEKRSWRLPRVLLRTVFALFSSPRM